YDVGRVVGELNRRIPSRAAMPTMLLGPGRWGTTTPSLGVPVHFSEISNMSVLGEIASIEGNLMPELSYGTHFFQDLVENRIFFVAIFPWRDGVYLNPSWKDGLESILEEILPEEGGYRDVIKVFDTGGLQVRIVADVVRQKVICYREGGQPRSADASGPKT
ncbi:MAG TPA: phosphoenolpyruvate synthase, partial [Deltaproteobacteria bacterium]|nr:phosphoenolpyruvate synthase [Deltaproteobacteria bacterium]